MKLYIFRARYIFIKYGKLYQKLIINAKRLCYLFLSLANIKVLKIEDVNLNFYLLDNEVWYLFLNEFIKTKDLVT